MLLRDEDIVAAVLTGAWRVSQDLDRFAGDAAAADEPGRDVDLELAGVQQQPAECRLGPRADHPVDQPLTGLRVPVPSKPLLTPISQTPGNSSTPFTSPIVVTP